MDTIFHIARRTDWEHAQGDGLYRATSLDSEGFIHCSTAAQLERTARVWFEGQRDLVLLKIDPGQLTSPLRYELAGSGEYPHLYGPLNLDAVVSAEPFAVD